VEQRDYEAAKLRLEVDQLKAQLEQQQSQLRGQQAALDTLMAQAKTGVLTPPPSSAVVPQVVPQTTAAGADASLLSGLPWALGGILLTFGGGIALVGMFTMFARQNRPSRSIEYIQDDYPAYLSNVRRRVQVLPPRRPIRRINVEDED
jgi:Tfp pilus assembly protein FimV